MFLGSISTTLEKLGFVETEPNSWTLEGYDTLLWVSDDEQSLMLQEREAPYKYSWAGASDMTTRADFEEAHGSHYYNEFQRNGISYVTYQYNGSYFTVLYAGEYLTGFGYSTTSYYDSFYIY